MYVMHMHMHMQLNVFFVAHSLAINSRILREPMLKPLSCATIIITKYLYWLCREFFGFKVLIMSSIIGHVNKHNRTYEQE